MVMMYHYHWIDHLIILRHVMDPSQPRGFRLGARDTRVDLFEELWCLAPRTKGRPATDLGRFLRETWGLKQ